jgi:hypothetical protein
VAGGWSPDKVRAIAAHYDDELRGRGVVVLTRVGNPLPYVHVPEDQEEYVSALCAAWLDDPEPEAVAPPVEHARAKMGKSYPADVAAAVVRRVLGERPSRALRDELYRNQSEVPGATTTLIDHVLKQMAGKRLSATRRQRWERAANELVDDGTVTLVELEKRLK